MSQQNINQALPNGLPPNWCGTTPNMVPPQKTQTFSPHNVNNGLGSSQSSRDSSPATRFSSVPTSQLPPLRGNIPSSQLPPGRPGLSPIPHNLETNSSNGHISASVTQQSENTPHSSPRVTNFSTSTPNPIPNLISKSTENSSVVQQTSVNNFPSNYTPQENTPSNIINSTNAPQNIRTNMSPQPAFNPSSMQPLKPPSKGPNLIKGQQTSLTHSSSTPTLPNLTQSGHLGRQDLNQPPAIQRPSSSGPQLQQQNPPNTQAELLSGPSQFAPAQNIMVNPLQQQPQNSPLNAPINSVNSMTQPSKPQNFPSQQNMPPVPISQPLSSDGNVPPKPQNIMGQQHMHPTLSEQNQQKNTPPSSVNSINQQQNLQFIATQQNMGQQQIPPVSQPVLLTSTQQINPPSTSVNNLVQSQNPQYFPTQQNMGPSNSQPISSIATQQINAPPNSGNNIGQPIKSQYFPQQNMGQPMPPTSEPIQPPSSINNMNQPIRPPYFTPQQNMGQQNVPLISKPVSAVTQQKNVTSSPINNMNQPPRPQYVAPQQNMSQPPLPPMQQKPPVPVDNRLQTNNMNYASQNTRPPLVSGTGIPPNSNYPTTPVSNLHSKRYPQPVNQNFPNTNQQGTTYPPTINNYNQPQQPTNTLYQQTNMYNQQQTNMYNQQQQQQQQQQYPQNYQQQQATQQRNYQQMTQQMQNMNIVKTGFNKLWGQDNYDLLQCPNVLPEEAIEPPKVRLGQEFLDAANCSPEIFRCTMTKIPENNSLLQKSRLPLGVLIHPFKDLNHLPVIQCNTIVRCRACRTYINPFIFFVDTKRWKCNLCYRVNELPEEFQYDPVSKSYGDPSRRPEIKSSTIEYIAPSEYMLRPPQPAVYLFLLDISRLAVESGYLHTVCGMLSSQLASLPGDARTQIGFIAYNSTLHFFSLAEGLNQPHEMIVSDVDDVFLPCPDNLLVNLKELMELVTDLLAQLPTRYQNTFDNGSALGAALQAAFKMMSSTGGRVTVFQASLPTLGPGALTAREDPNQRAGKEAPHLNPATDFYKRLALDCSGHQIAVDLFILNSQYVDIATLSGISRFSGGCMYHFPLFNATKTIQVESLERCFQRYLTRKIGFEAVMRIRCTRGLAIHTFHGNFFVRSTDLLSLPNVNPDAGFGMQVSIEESLSDLQSVCFQAALLYTSSKGERRIRVHTLCLPVVNTLSDVLNSADQQCIVGILSKMAVDRSLQSSLSDARDAFINVAIDILSSYKLSLNMGTSASGLLAPQSLKLLPLYILALLKYTAFRTGTSTRLDDRVFAMCDMKTLPLAQLVQHVYPDLYPIYRLAECPNIVDNEGVVIPQPRRLQLTSRNIDTHGAYLLDAGQHMYIYVCQNVSQQFLVHTLGVPNFKSIPDQCYELQTIDNPDNQRLHAFINSLNDEKPYSAALQIIRDDSPNRILMLERLVEDRIEFALSYNEFLQHLKTQVK